ncbi:MAG TPA: ArsA-related P-loop ATPase, partial [Candidatus Limnocylindria bacterium]|nr:ArsA-related P-loop ATPase [Candidatus Limnocylindria bacterium]
MAARLRLTTQRLVVVTGKGGVGKSSVAAALARAASAKGRRVLAVEVGRGGLGRLLGVDAAPGEPVAVGRHLAFVTVEPEAALADMVHGVLRLGVLARRLLQSVTFQIVAAAAPGLPEYLVLHRLAAWLDAKRFGRRQYDLVVVDAPASGHSLPLLTAPRTLGALAALGPVADFLARIRRTLADPAATAVWIVTTPEELAVREAVELHAALAAELGETVAPPIVNGIPRRRFSSRDEALLAATTDPSHPYVRAARLEIAREHDARTQIRALHRGVRRTPVRLPVLPPDDAGAPDVVRLARAVG